MASLVGNGYEFIQEYATQVTTFLSRMEANTGIFSSSNTHKGLISLDLAGIFALANFKVIQERTALAGTSFLDIFLLCPGIHLQEHANDLNNAEYPACAALTSGYVFRVENPATVYYLQRVGRPGHLTTLSLTGPEGRRSATTKPSSGPSAIPKLAYLGAVSATFLAIARLYHIEDSCGIAVISIFILARTCNYLVLSSRSKMGWKGQPEPGVKGDLLILMCQDKWIRLQGYVDDLKATVSGQWLRDSTNLENTVMSMATILVYVAIILTPMATFNGQLTLLLLLMLSTGLLGTANLFTDRLTMYGRVIEVIEGPKNYPRRLTLAEELIKETGRDDWAVRLGMINAENSKSKTSTDGGVTM